MISQNFAYAYLNSLRMGRKKTAKILICQSAYEKTRELEVTNELVRHIFLNTYMRK